MNHDAMHPDDTFSLDGEALLLGRIVDRRDDLDDWRALDGQAADDPAVHARLALLLQDDCALRGVLDRELAGADHVGAPVFARRPWFTRLSRASGWAAALLVAALWALQGVSSGDAHRPASADAPAVGAGTMGGGGMQLVRSEATPSAGSRGEPARFDARVPRPRSAAGYALAPSAPGSQLLGELAPELVGTRPLADGSGVEVITMRRVLEREVVDSVVTLGEDDLGRTVPVPVPADQLLADEIY